MKVWAMGFWWSGRMMAMIAPIRVAALATQTRPTMIRIVVTATGIFGVLARLGTWWWEGRGDACC